MLGESFKMLRKQGEWDEVYLPERQMAGVVAALSIDK
jgi:hypothetical protein